jgi:methyl-accepting chemotaxis protein
MYGNPAAIRRLAQKMRNRAGDLRHQADDLVSRTEGHSWVSLAADRMRERAVEMADKLRSTAGDYDEAAERLDAHAREVQRLLDLIEEIENRVTNMISAAKDRIASTAKAIAEGVKDLVSGADDAFDKLLSSFDQPPPGHKDWLDVPDRLGIG